MKRALLLLLLSVTCVAAKHAPLPQKLLDAKSVYIDGHSYARLTDDVYDELSKWKRFTLVNEPAQADIIFRLSADGTAENSTLSVIDPATGNSIWAITRDWNSRLGNIVGKSSGRELVRDLRKRMER